MVSIYELGSKLIDILELFHSAGYVHNDISLDKIVLGANQMVSRTPSQDETENTLEDKTVHIVDFQYMTPYIDFETKKHLKQEKVKGVIDVGNQF